MAEAWLNSPCTDPFGRVFAREGRIFRALFRESADQALRILEHPAVQALVQDGLVARMWRSDEKVEGYGPVLEAEKAAFDVPCARFSFGALRQAALDWLEIARRLLPAELCLGDAHYGNFMLFAANRPRCVDLGALRPAAVLAEERPFRGFTLFWEAVAAPLLLLARDPGRSRLARLAIGDQPLQGPRFADDEPPLSVVELVPDLKALLLSACEGLSAEAALGRAARFIAERAPLPPAPRPQAPEVDARAPAHVGALLSQHGCASVACMGADAYFCAADALSGRDVLVVEPSPARMRELEGSMRAGIAARSVALYQEHALNRLFRRQGMRAEAVVAVDPLRALEHHSGAEHANIAEVLADTAGRAVVVVAPYRQRAATSRILAERFGSVESQHFGWPYGGWDVMVCPKH